MSTQKVPRVRFNLKSHKSKNKDVLIHAIVRYKYNGEKVKLVYTSGEKIKPEFWDVSIMRAKKRIVQFKGVNKRLDHLEDTIIETWEKNGALPKDTFKAQLDIKLGRSKANDVLGNSTPNYVQFAKLYVDELEADPSFNPNTLKAYKTAYNIILEYGKLYSPLQYETFTWQFRSIFKNWLYSYKKYAKGSAAKYFKTITFFLKESNKRYNHGNTIYREDGWNLPTVKTKTTVPFTFREIKKVKDYDYKGNETLQKTADIFVAMCHFGQRISDWDQIKLDAFTGEEGEKLLKIMTTKTGGEAVIPLFPEAEEILIKYNYELPSYSDAAYNRNIKKVIKLVLPNKTFTRLYSTSGKEYSEVAPAHKYVTSHSCRKSFAQNYYAFGISIANLMVCTNHATEAQFLEYAEVDKEDAARRAKKEYEARKTNLKLVKAS